MKTNFMKKIVGIIVLLLTAFMLTSCDYCGFYEEGTDCDYVQIYYNPLSKKAFAGEYISANIINIYIPEEFNECKVTALGGYVGIGEKVGFLGNFFYAYERISEEEALAKNKEIKYKTYTIYLTKNIEELNGYIPNGVIYLKPHGEYYTNLYCYDFNYVCPAENKHFYTDEDGNLLEK